MTGLGVLFMTAGLSQVPALLRGRGVDAVTAGQVMFLVAAAIGLVSVLVLARGLRPGTGTAPEQQAGWRQLATAGLRGARNPRILLSYGCAFTGRADVALKGTFVSMWALVAAPAAGLTPADALGRGGMMLGIMGAVALVWTPLFGLLLDRVNRVSGVALAVGLAGIGYTGMGFIESPLVNSAIPAFILLAVGQVSAIQASVTLVGQEAPPAERGGVVAMNAWFGALGILVSTLAGGWLFDNWAPAGPFVLAGIVQLVLCGAAVAIRLLAPGPVRVRA
jgi:MFS family permease